MVAISLYRGDLHKVPDVPRRWTTPKPTISLKDFKILLRRRSRTLSRLRSSPVATTSASIPNPNPCPNLTDTNSRSVPFANGDNNCETKLPHAEDLKEEEEERGEEEGEEAVKQLADKADALLEVKNDENCKNVDKIDFPSEPEVEARSNTVAVISDNEKRIKEIKEKLEILNEKKHSLVQVLKQILNAEELLKSQSSTQGNSGRPPLPLQVDAAADSGSMTKIKTPRIGSDGNQCGDTDVGDADDGVNRNLQPRQLPHMSSTSPSSDSQQRKAALNMMPHSYRTTLTVAGSPPRFAPAAGGPRPSSVSASGTSYIASSPSPSPAASGGTSVFRDVRLPSPWN